MDRRSQLTLPANPKLPGGTKTPQRNQNSPANDASSVIEKRHSRKNPNNRFNPYFTETLNPNWVRADSLKYVILDGFAWET